MAALTPLRRGKSSLMVTHRLDQIDQADQLLLLEQGQLIAAGTPGQLQTPGSPLAKLLGKALPPSTDEEPDHA